METITKTYQGYIYEYRQRTHCFYFITNTWIVHIIPTLCLTSHHCFKPNFILDAIQVAMFMYPYTNMESIIQTYQGYIDEHREKSGCFYFITDTWMVCIIPTLGLTAHSCFQVFWRNNDSDKVRNVCDDGIEYYWN